MPRSRESYQAAGSIGGLRTAALTVDRKAHTAPARAALLAKYLDQIPPEITDPADRMDRALKLRRADMIALSQRAARAREAAAKARRELREAETALAEITDGAA